MYKVKNAIILAAGRGSRLKHLTANTPKPLLIPRDKPFIENIIENLIEKNIKEIHVVVGYLKEQFTYLEEKYGVNIIENKDWNNGNNITSIYAALNVLDNSLIVNGDIIMTENVFQTEYETALTYAEKDSHIDEWLIINDDNGNVVDFDKNGIDKEGFYQREIIFITKEYSNLIQNYKDAFDIQEYQEYMILKISEKHNLPFKMLEVPKRTIFDLDTVEEFEEYKKTNY